MTETRPFQRWIWLELTGFDNTADDMGVSAYIDTAGFVPEAICLLVSSIDFVMQHPGMDRCVELPPDVCSRQGHALARGHGRQHWTNHQVRQLTEHLQRRGTRVYLSFFPQYTYDRYHKEWASDHTEVLCRHNDVDHFGAVNPLKRFADGTRFQDVFTEALLEVTDDYGFDGWHGPDGFGPLSGPLTTLDFSDDLIDQFTRAAGVELPRHLVDSDQADRPSRIRRAEHIWSTCRGAWIGFWADRWTDFWRTVTEALHARGKQTVINNAWTRAPFEALYRYGVDYRAIARAGVDAMVLETCAASLAMDPRPSTRDPLRAYDVSTMVQLMRACLPEMTMVYLQTTHDIVEQWNAIDHVPTVLEREVHSVSTVTMADDPGPRRCIDGALTCLGDGMSRHDWQCINRWQSTALETVPQRVLGATVVWSDALVEGQLGEYPRHRTMHLHRVLMHLADLGAPVPASVRADRLDVASGALLVIHGHLFDESDLGALARYRGGPIVLIGPEVDGLADRLEGLAVLFTDAEPTRPLQCAVVDPSGCITAPEAASFTVPEMDLTYDDEGLRQKFGYWDRLPVRPVSDGFLRACTEVVWQAVRHVEGPLGVVDDHGATTGDFMQSGPDQLRVSLKNRLPWYARPTVTVPRTIERATIATGYPLMEITPEGNTFSVRVPGRGLTVVDLELASEEV